MFDAADFNLSQPADFKITGNSVSVRSNAGDDIFIDPYTGNSILSAVRYLYDSPLEFTFEFVASASSFSEVFDSVALLGWVDEVSWFKLCLELDPQKRLRIVSVVNNNVSDDSNGPFVFSDNVRLQCRRSNEFISLHYFSDDGSCELIRCFQLSSNHNALKVGFTVQSPLGNGFESTIRDISLINYFDGNFRGF